MVTRLLEHRLYSAVRIVTNWHVHTRQGWSPSAPCNQAAHWEEDGALVIDMHCFCRLQVLHTDPAFVRTSQLKYTLRGLLPVGTPDWEAGVSCSWSTTAAHL